MESVESDNTTQHTPNDREHIKATAVCSATEVVMRFDELCRTTNSLFSRIQQLPRYSADHTKWKSLFFHAFSQFDVLWQYQQEQRQTLELRRSQIGEIGSKIAQLYFSYYLHTSQAKYLREAISFYDAILKRDYFDWQAQTGVNAISLMHKKLRCYARAIQTSFFIEDFKLAQEYMTRISEIIQKDKSQGIPEEYAQVLTELSSVLSAVCLPVEEDMMLTMSPFQTLLTAPPVNTDSVSLVLAHSLLVGGHSKQNRLIDFTIDHYRIMRFLAWVAGEGSQSGTTHFHRISPLSLLETLSSIADALSPSQALLLYLSGESSPPHLAQADAGDPHHSYSTNSILLRGHQNSSSTSQADQLFLDDIYPLMRRPFFLLIDSPGFLPQPDSLSFPERFHQPFICLVSPVYYPVTIENYMTRGGGLLSLFISSPLQALCVTCGIQSLSAKLASSALQSITQIEDIAFSSLSNLPNLPPSYRQLCTDNTLQCIVRRFLFLWACLRLHMGFKKDHMPRCYPPIPLALFQSTYLNTELYELFRLLDVSEMFVDVSRAMDL